MGSSGLEENQKTASPKDIINYLNDLFDYALSIGMTYEEYWLQDPLLLEHYIKAEEMRVMRKNQELWLQGLYVHIAIADLVPVLNPFSKDHKPKKYLESPLPITQKEQEELRLKRIEKWTNQMMSRIKNQDKKDSKKSDVH